MSARFASLDAWLAWQERLHPSTIDLGLERVQRVFAALGLGAFDCPVITVGGTNGKGSCVALLDGILGAGRLKVGTFTSPHLSRYNERVRIAGVEASDAALMRAFERIEDVRGAVSLTFFEYNTLAALFLFADARLDALILEVGLGGRLDAVNIIDADSALLVSVGIDHVEWLGATLEAIGREKAGIFRAGRAAVLGDRAMPASVRQAAREIGARLVEPGRDFRWSHAGARWRWEGAATSYDDLPAPALAGARQFDNAAAVLAVLETLADRLAVSRAAVAQGLESVELAGRFERVASGSVEWIFDVAHNAAAAATLAENLRDLRPAGRVIAVFGALKDKDVAAIVAAVAPVIDEWLLVDLPGERGLAADELERRAFAGRTVHARRAGSLRAALEAARTVAQAGDRVVVFGSFHVVGPALEWHRLYSRAPKT
ncbi:MAG TPA: bifunctional tetrahydrofolate synthase/dihydrofolate synthase [Steroidobacteraceae bacterium]|nr:bifunctional tetrahydrofolate synthase/dihydrofolate synthase [Steroidobacteraceae bacterium]